MSIELADNIERYDWLKGNGKNPKGITLTLTNTDGGGGKQTSTVTIAGAGTSGLTSAQLLASIERVHVYASATGAFKDYAEDTNAVSYAGGTAAVIAVVQFKQGYVIPVYAAGF